MTCYFFFITTLLPPTPSYYYYHRHHMLLFTRSFTTHTASFLPLPRPFSSSFTRFLSRQISSEFPPFDQTPKNSNHMGTDESLEQGGRDSPVIREEGPVMQLADTFQGNEEYIMVDSNLVPLHHRNMKNCSLPFSTRHKPSSDKQPESMSMSDHLPSTPNATVSEHRKFRRTRVDLGSAQSDGDVWVESSLSSNFGDNSLSLNETLQATNYKSHHNESLQHSHFWKARANRKNNVNYAASGHKLDSSVSMPKFKPFDICFHGKRDSALIADTIHEKNQESCIELLQEGAKERILGPGMVLLKHYITHDEQVEIVKICRELGLGPGGFYPPGYANGAKLRLQMMCLGLDWDPQTRKYGNKRLVDGIEPPSIPHNFSKLVIKAIQEAHCLIKKECGASYVEDVLPLISPDICIVNFYDTNGRLGLHQDRDESRESLQKGLPVVSFSIGDSAEFLYGYERDVDKAANVLLESGDVLIFGGESRHVFHGVSSIIPNSAPKELLRDTWLYPGRLNLTFRQY